ncbi:MAG: hypothetical protein AAF497_00565, partial [Planctomycetota bacterium]
QPASLSRQLLFRWDREALHARGDRQTIKPDQIDLFVPFIFLHMSWNPMSGDAAFTPKTDRERHRSIEDFGPTTIANFFELWRDFDGRRLPVEFDRDWLDIIAVHDKGRISLAITNMGGRQLAVDLSSVAKQIQSTGATQTRLNYHEGQVVFEPEHAVDVAAVPVDVNETTIVRLTLSSPLSISSSRSQERVYAGKTAVRSKGGARTFTIKIDEPANVTKAKLVVGLHRRGGITEPLNVSLNGTAIDIELGDAAEFTEFFAPLDAAIPVVSLRKSNEIKITAQEESTITSVQLLLLR